MKCGCFRLVFVFCALNLLLACEKNNTPMDSDARPNALPDPYKEIDRQKLHLQQKAILDRSAPSLETLGQQASKAQSPGESSFLEQERYKPPDILVAKPHSQTGGLENLVGQSIIKEQYLQELNTARRQVYVQEFISNARRAGYKVKVDPKTMTVIEVVPLSRHR